MRARRRAARFRVPPPAIVAAATVVLALAAAPAFALDTRLVPTDLAPDDPERLGNFRILCDFSHAANDDPIVRPGQSGGSHYHFFFGNTLTDANTTTESLLGRGGSTCQGQTLNRSAYWIPALFDAAGQPRIPDVANFYYKNQTAEPRSKIVALPRGLRMIAGDPRGNVDDGLLEASWRCRSWPYDAAHPDSVTLPDCAAGDELTMNITFPECWDGRRLTSIDQSHVAYAVWSGAAGGDLCPPSHPEVMPQITYQFSWYHPDRSTGGWHLSSDRHAGANRPEGSTLHGDWWNGWQARTMDVWVQKCLREARDCDTGNLGNRTALVREFQAGGGVLRRPHGASGGRWCNGRRATLVGTDGDDTLRGTSGDDVVVALGGADRIDTFGGRDVICAGPGDDVIDAGAGADDVRGGGGDDLVRGASGRDRIHGGAGDDTLDGGGDDDALYGNAGADTLRVGEGHDWAFGGGGDDTLEGSHFTDRLHGGPGNDALYGIGGTNLLDGGDGTDVCDAGGQRAYAVRRCP